MSYFIDIVDTTSPLTQIVVENASASGIVLNWNGGDTKDEASIVSSELNFDMLTKTADDAAFINFFTGDEHRFKVMIKDSVDDAIIWQGYVLPDLYSEPYKNVCFFVSFTATDGLGRLKGKYLPEEYYSREKSLIDIYCQILKLTGIELDLYFLPAIENFVNKDWNTIYINTENFIDGKKKKDAYSILETLLQDTLCVCYQADNRWYIEGLNQRNVRQVAYKKYNTEGVFVENVAYNRLLKNITPLVTPIITIIPPYNEITVTHKKVEPFFPNTLAKEVNDGWAFTTGVISQIYANEWIGHGGLYAYCIKPDYYARIIFENGIFDPNKWISLKSKIYISKGQKVQLKFNFDIKRLGNSTENPADMNYWKNPFRYEIMFNDVILYSNFGGVVNDFENVIFNESASAVLDIEHIFVEEGLFDIKIYAPSGDPYLTLIESVIIKLAEIQIIGFSEDETESDIISGDFTIDKTIDLTFGEDKSGFSPAFRLAKLKEQTTFFNEIEIPILHAFEFSGKYYSQVQLDGTFLIKNNKFQVYNSDNLIQINDVIYNWNDAEQMLVETAEPFVTGTFIVKKYAVDDFIESRSHWIQWTDAIYKIENSSYSKSVANIYRRIFNQAAEKLDVTALDAVKFNDIILFKYVYEKDFFVLNCSWNLDENKTTLTLGRSYYKDANSTTPGDENIPPIVLAGDDIYIEDGITTTSLLATAYDPDGYIASQIWTKKVGSFGDIIETPFELATNLQNLTEDFYTYKIEVTDNDGASASDFINIIRKKNYLASLDLIPDYEDLNYVRYQLNVSPELLPTTSITFSGSIDMSCSVAGWSGHSVVSYRIVKNGNIIETALEVTNYSGIIPITLNYIATDIIFIDIHIVATVEIDLPATANARVEVNINNAIITSGFGNIIGLPIIVVEEKNVTSIDP